MQTETVDLRRRALLKGRSKTTTELRPPWAQPSGSFEDLCTRCSACIEHCPQGIIKKGDGGFPVIDFSAGECIFCADCVACCETGALLRSPEKPPWTYQAQVSENCLCFSGVQCMSCRDECGHGSIDFQPTTKGVFAPVINLNTCNGCGACQASCPVNSISIQDANHRDDKHPE